MKIILILFIIVLLLYFSQNLINCRDRYNSLLNSFVLDNSRMDQSVIENFQVEKGKCCIDNLGDKYYFARRMSWEKCKEKVAKCNPPSRCQVTWTPLDIDPPEGGRADVNPSDPDDAYKESNNNLDYDNNNDQPDDDAVTQDDDSNQPIEFSYSEEGQNTKKRDGQVYDTRKKNTQQPSTNAPIQNYNQQNNTQENNNQQSRETNTKMDKVDKTASVNNTATTKVNYD